MTTGDDKPARNLSQVMEEVAPFESCASCKSMVLFVQHPSGRCRWWNGAVTSTYARQRFAEWLEHHRVATS